ncbi:LytTR family DNA-binding domain-containing protein [Pedobacter sp.]|jgi:two-component system LytT family response regulator|uniref:LytR/AlgR family response regulator transcription factor n=1 Tax=Pedobacter sp. TaxID=1411316 RepID=UPI002BB7F82D|nr:LytTR family DNA-binding domain-containing protein [Pedobacter sp.]HWW42918.1 LytTR family DNA-binding domain-containing protein [Pedobacter sp.]
MENNKSIRCVVLDDDFQAVRLLAGYVKNTVGLELILKTTDTDEAITSIIKGMADLVFLDIQMPKLTGIEFMEGIKQTQTKVVLTTAYSEYALKGYEHDVIDYLLKPVTFERFMIAVQKAKERLLDKPGVSAICADHIMLKTEYRLQKTNYSDILYIEGLGDYLIFYTEKERIITLERMKRMEDILPAACFIRVHKSYIVNINRINYLEKGKIVIGENRLPVGETYRQTVKAKLHW